MAQVTPHDILVVNYEFFIALNITIRKLYSNFILGKSYIAIFYFIVRKCVMFVVTS